MSRESLEAPGQIIHLGWAGGVGPSYHRQIYTIEWSYECGDPGHPHGHELVADMQEWEARNGMTPEDLEANLIKILNGFWHGGVLLRECGLNPYPLSDHYKQLMEG